MIWESFRRRSSAEQSSVKRFLRHIGCAVRTFDRTIEERSKLHAENRQTDFRNYNDANLGNQPKTITTKWRLLRDYVRAQSRRRCFARRIDRARARDAARRQ